MIRVVRNRTPLAFLFVVAALTSSCTMTLRDGQSPESAWYPKGEFQKTLPLEKGATLSLENINGDINIQGWDEDKVEITATERRGYLQSPRFYSFGARPFEPKIDVESSEGTIRVRTASIGKEEDELREVNYDLWVPRPIKLDGIRNGQGAILIADTFGSAEIRQKEGDIKVRNFSGSLDILLGSGTVEAELLDVRAEDKVVIETEQGDIVLFLEPGLEAQIEASAPEGSISSEIDFGQPLPAKKLLVEPGEGRASFSLTARHGDIKINKVEERS
jgi:DUF4097 and DUF4098 domain-containing protein YvlB